MTKKMTQKIELPQGKVIRVLLNDLRATMDCLLVNHGDTDYLGMTFDNVEWSPDKYIITMNEHGGVVLQLKK